MDGPMPSFVSTYPAPCYLREMRSCPNNHICMQNVTATMVIERVKWVLARSLIKTTSSMMR